MAGSGQKPRTRPTVSQVEELGQDVSVVGGSSSRDHAMDEQRRERPEEQPHDTEFFRWVDGLHHQIMWRIVLCRGYSYRVRLPVAAVAPLPQPVPQQLPPGP